MGGNLKTMEGGREKRRRKNCVEEEIEGKIKNKKMEGRLERRGGKEG